HHRAPHPPPAEARSPSTATIGWPLADVGTVAAAAGDDPVALQLPVGSGHGAAGQAEVAGQLADGAQPGPGGEDAAGHHGRDLGPELLVGWDRRVGPDAQDHALARLTRAGVAARWGWPARTHAARAARMAATASHRHAAPRRQTPNWPNGVPPCRGASRPARGPRSDMITTMGTDPC